MVKKLVWLLLALNFSNTTALSKEKYVIGCRSVGFFSNFFQVLNHLDKCEQAKKIPVVYWGSACPYYTKEGYNGSFNVWEYYFEPVSHLRYEFGDKVYTEYRASVASNNPACYFDKKYKLYFNSLINKYVCLKKNVRNKIDNFYTTNNMDKVITIGVHLRGTDKFIEVNPIDPLIILNKAKQIALHLKKKCQFFIATDEEKLLELAKSVLKKNVIYYDSQRSSNGKPIHYNRTFNKPLLGEEVLIEALLLSKCTYFLHTVSNVSMAVCFFNPDVKNILLHKRNLIAAL